MARRKLSTGGRIVAAGLSVGVAAGLVGAMAAGDSSAHTSQSVTVPDGGGAASAHPYASSDDGGSIQSAPQAHTRSGGS